MFGYNIDKYLQLHLYVKVIRVRFQNVDVDIVLVNGEFINYRTMKTKRFMN